jgi:hypothetical protein
MAKRRSSGYYDVGRIEPKPGGLNPRSCGTFGVIKGDTVEQNGHVEWSHICEGAMKTSKWFAFRIGPGDNVNDRRTELLKPFDSKDDAVAYLERRYGSKFDETY